METRYSARLHSPEKSSSEIDSESAVLCGALGVLWCHTLILTFSYGVAKVVVKLKKKLDNYFSTLEEILQRLLGEGLL